MSWLTIIRRFLVVAALMFWQGGFTFYASVVVPLGQEVFGMEQGFLTQRVTNYLNLAGAVALALLAVDAAGERVGRRRWRLRWMAWCVMAASLVALVLLHARLDALLEADNLRILDRHAFRPGHRLYLWISTIQWAAMLAYLALTLSIWLAADRRRALARNQADSLK
jgi:hypothetical protein